jgi:superfamily II DNA or RNA helicase
MSSGQKNLFGDEPAPALDSRELALNASINLDEQFVLLLWKRPDSTRPVFTAWIHVLDSEIKWCLSKGRGADRYTLSTTDGPAIRERLQQYADLHHITSDRFEAAEVFMMRNSMKRQRTPLPPLGPGKSPWEWLAERIRLMALDYPDPPNTGFWLSLTEERERAEKARRRQNEKAAILERLERERKRTIRLAREAAEQIAKTDSTPSAAAVAPLPTVPIRVESPNLELQDTAFPLANLSGFHLREKASLWWISNQSDDLLCLPYCRIERLDYQVRTALRVLGPLRGRGLLSDEVGLGKTIEAGLILKELLTRGMVKRFLVLTVPSLVDQWEEELSDKFGLETATTNQGVFRSGNGRFWQENFGIVASLHTVKQPAQLEAARQVNWDMLIVDEAHYLRNSESQAWRAVSALPRQFMLLLTATPVQNSLDELYNLVTLLQPGQLPPPREFRKRFIDPKRPRQPREPEELRRLLGQVMIRNTRSNAGLKLPPRRAETVLFEPGAGEQVFWKNWESDFRKRLEALSPSQASLWGRLLLQAAGSSPAAWRAALKKFPDQEAAQSWCNDSPLDQSWARKCELLHPLTRGEGGVVIFTQFLETQAAVAERLRAAGSPVRLINGSTPPPERQPITEEFRKAGGALVLTHSGTEGRNLQFCHRLVNFDLPWNPMEIEQRIGRLHRYGQRQTVRIYNFTQAGTLQQHLLDVLQEKLNLFELVVGETGLVLGERFDSDSFAEEVLRIWRESEGQLEEAFAGMGNELQAARGAYEEVKELDQTLFSEDYASTLSSE